MSKWLEQPKYILTIVAVVGALATAIVTMSDYIKLPETTVALAGQVQNNEQDIDSVERWIEVQQEANELQRQWQEEQQYGYRQWTPRYEPKPPAHCWDDYWQAYYDCDTGDWL